VEVDPCGASERVARPPVCRVFWIVAEWHAGAAVAAAPRPAARPFEAAAGAAATSPDTAHTAAAAAGSAVNRLNDMGASSSARRMRARSSDKDERAPRIVAADAHSGAEAAAHALYALSAEDGHGSRECPPTNAAPTSMLTGWSRARCGAGRTAPTLPVISSANSSHLNTTDYQLAVTSCTLSSQNPLVTADRHRGSSMSAQAASHKVLTVSRMLLRAEGTGGQNQKLPRPSPPGKPCQSPDLPWCSFPASSTART